MTAWITTSTLGLGFWVAMVAVTLLLPVAIYRAMRVRVLSGTETAARIQPSDLALSAGLALAVILVYWSRLTNHDIAWYLFATRDWLAGAELYVEIVEVNPPLNFYLTLPALGLADLLGIGDQQGHYVAVALLLAFGLVWSGRILLGVHGLATPQRLAFLLGTSLAVLLPTLNGLGQREQILVIFLLPWALIEAAPHPLRRGQTLAAAQFAAIGMCLKPHFVVFPLAVTILNCLETRSFRPVLAPANMVFMGTGLAYIGYVWAVHPTYLLQTVPTAAWVYGAFGKPMPEVLSEFGPNIGLFLLLVAVAYRSRAMTREVRLFVALALGGILSYLLQSTGFHYHKAPFFAFTALASFFLIHQSRRNVSVLLLATSTAAAAAVFGVQLGFYQNNALPEITKVTDDLGPIRQLITLSSQIHTGPPIALALGADWASGYPHNWLVPGAVNRLAKTDCKVEVEACRRLEDIAAQNRTANIRDIDRLRPDLLIVDRKSAVFDKPGFDWLAFMAQDPAWASVFASYKRVAVSNRFTYFLRDRGSEKTPP